MKTFLLVIFLIFNSLINGQTSDYIQIKCNNYNLTLWGNSFYRNVDPATLEITCGYLNPIDSIFYSCNGNIICIKENINQMLLQDGSGCCIKSNRNVCLNLDNNDHYINAVLKKLWYTKSKVILRKKDIGKIYLNIDDPIEKAKIANLKNGEEYTFNLTNK